MILLKYKFLTCITSMFIFIIFVLFVISISLFAFSGCLNSKRENFDEPAKYTSYLDIPDLSAEEIAAIKELQNEYKTFLYGVPVSTEAFFDHTGEIKGFAKLFCDWLTDLFDIEFKPVNYEFTDLLPALDTGEVDFAGGLSPTEERKKIYFMTDAFAERSLMIYRIESSRPFSEIKKIRKLKLVFLKSSATTDLALSLLEKDSFEAIFVEHNADARKLIETGEADGFIHQNTTDIIFNDAQIVSEDFIPPAFVSVCLTAQNDKMAPIISAVQKALEHGQLKYLSSLYTQSEHEYAVYKLFSRLSEEETQYIKDHPVIPAVAEYGNYPVSFYNKYEKQWQGVSHDILNRISALTGISFEMINDTDANWPELSRILESGRAVMISGLTRSDHTEQYFSWAAKPIILDKPSLISKVEYHHIKLNEILYLKIGLVQGSIYSEIYKRFFPGHKNIFEYDSAESAFAALADDDIDMVFLGESSLLNLTNYRETAGYKNNMVFEYPVESAFGFNKGEDVLRSIVDKAMAVVETNGITEQWMKKTYDYRVKVAETKLPWAIGVSFLLLCVLTLTAILIIKKTREEKIERTKKMEEDIREANERTEILLNAMPLSCHLWTRDLEIFDCNDENVRLFNLRDKQEFLDNFFQFSPEYQPDGRLSGEAAAAFIRQAFEEGRCEFHFMHQTLNGEPIPTEITLVRVAYKNDYAVAAYVRDLREYNKNIRAIEERDDLLSMTNHIASILLQSEFDNFKETLRSCMGIIADAVGIDRIYICKNHNVNNRLYFSKIHEWSNGSPSSKNDLSTSVPYDKTLPDWERILSGGDCMNCTASNMFPEEQAYFSQQGISAVLAVPVFVKDRFWGYVSYGNCRGERLFTENEQAILRSSGMIIVNALLTNEAFIEMIELQKKLKEENINALKQFEMIWNEVDNGMVIIDIETRTVLDANPAACDMLGDGENIKIIGEKCYKFFGQHECPIIDYHRTVDREERKLIKSDGTVIPILKSISKIQYNGRPAFLECFTDISYLKAAADQKRMLEVAEQASKTKSDFLANMSHEMRTPLNAVIGLTGLSLEHDELMEETRANIEKIYNAGATLLSIVNDVLDISKIEAGRLELVEIDYDVPSLINDTVTQNIMRIGEKPIEFVLDLDEDIFARLYGDELKIKQIMNNLLSNAIKYTQQGAVTLAMHCDREEDTVWITVKISDTGKGIRPEDLSKLFSDYAQVDLKANRSIEGTGLGLSISKKLAEMMGGTLTAESEYGKGSVFTVRVAQKFVTDIRIGPQIVENLKKFRYHDEKRNQNMRIKRIQLPYARVLIVDDNLTNLEVARGLMTPYGMQIDCVTSGQEAINAIHTESFHGETVRYNAVFMDHMMPGMDGMEATRHIREIDTDYAKNIPVIALTANAISGNEKKFLDSGFQAFLLKPINLLHLDEVIRRWIRDKSKEKENPDEETSGENEPDHAGLRFDNTDPVKNNTIAGLDIGKGIERFGGEEAYFKILRSYVGNTRPLLDSITEVDENTLPDYAITVHGIKGSSYGIFADPLGKKAENLEKSAKIGDLDFVCRNNAGFVTEAKELIIGIENMLSEITAANPKPKKAEPDKNLLQKLVVACKEYNIGEVDEIIAELEKYDYESDSGFINWVNDSLAKGYFETIIEKLSVLTDGQN